jgi:hypothetical protein
MAVDDCNVSEQIVVDRIKNQILELPDFKEKTEENYMMRIYALIELAYEITPSLDFLDDVFNEVYCVRSELGQ